MRIIRSRIPAIVTATLCLVALSACSPAPSPSPSPSMSGGSSGPSPSQTPSPSLAPLDPNSLFRISVTATAPSGAIAELVQTVFKPVAASATQASDETELDAQCDGWRAQYPGAQFVVSTITAMDRSPAGVSWGTTSPAVVSMDGKPVFTGDASSFQAYCASAQLGIGSARGVSPVDGGSADGPHGWASAVFGFGVATDPAFDKTTQGPYVMFSNCTIELSPFAIANSTKAAAWQSVAQQYPLYGCMFGESTAP